MGKIERKAKIGKSESTQKKLSEAIERQLQEAEEKKRIAREMVVDKNQIRFDFPDNVIPAGKMVIKLDEVRFRHEGAHEDLFGPINFILTGPRALGIEGQEWVW